MNKKHIELFKNLGGEFRLTPAEIEERVRQIRGFIFDWDGVYHPGRKGENQPGTFSEADSMGTNMLRYGHWRRHGSLPFIAIISGERDKTAPKFAEREHFNAIYTGISNKKHALEHACEAAGVEPTQIACVYDDINDITMVKHCGLKLQIRRNASPMFTQYMAQKGYSDYLTAHQPQGHAIREICELLMALTGDYTETIESRVAFDQQYQAYWKARNAKNTTFYTWKDNQVILKDKT
ncbi:MAG: hypothetical protein GY757_50245 [bacterium]|nr:hypothetical protein [bacterium]